MTTERRVWLLRHGRVYGGYGRRGARWVRMYYSSNRHPRCCYLLSAALARQVKDQLEALGYKDIEIKEDDR